MTYNEIDYEKLNDKIVNQAYTTYDKEAFHRLIEAKIERARALSESQEAFARGSKYTSS